MGIIAVQSYFLRQTWSIKEKQLIQTIEIALKNTALRFSKLNQTGIPARNPVHRLSPDYFVVDINSVIDANILEYYLMSEFEKLSLPLDYEYGIYDCHTDRMVYGDYVPAKGSKQMVVLKKELPKYSDYLYYFGVRFPALKTAIAADMTVWFFFTAILLISVVFFAYALLVILRQKRWSELQKDFMNNMTHEFKTPISSIKLASNVLMAPMVAQQPERLKVYATLIHEQNARLNQLVDKVLEIAKIESNNVLLTRELIDPLRLIQSVTENFRNSLQKETVFTLHADPGVGLIEADVVHFTNILYNLADNAVKYGNTQPAISIRLSRSHKHLLLQFSDNGPGIPKKYKHQVFRKFFRVPAGNTQQVKGFGLGLYYVKMICKGHGWRIHLQTVSPQPASFVIKIPLPPNS
jgi:two-component system phosphate regulon sensor histidine kinase PhoR